MKYFFMLVCMGYMLKSLLDLNNPAAFQFDSLMVVGFWCLEYLAELKERLS